MIDTITNNGNPKIGSTVKVATGALGVITDIQRDDTKNIYTVKITDGSNKLNGMSYNITRSQFALLNADN